MQCNTSAPRVPFWHLLDLIEGKGILQGSFQDRLSCFALKLLRSLFQFSLQFLVSPLSRFYLFLVLGLPVSEAFFQGLPNTLFYLFLGLRQFLLFFKLEVLLVVFKLVLFFPRARSLAF